MSISLVGIISVQVYWIKDAISNKQKQFENDVTVALNGSSERIKEKELNNLKVYIKPFVNNEQSEVESVFKNFFFQQIDTFAKSKLTFSSTILEENFKIPSKFINNDTILIRQISGKNDVHISRTFTPSNEEFRTSLLKKTSYSSYDSYNNLNRLELEKAYQEMQKFNPIHKRITNNNLYAILKEELAKRNITQDFKYAVYDDGFATPLKSGYFNIEPSKDLYYPLFEDGNGNSKYKLYIKFPNRHENLLSGMMKILLLSLLFIGIIIAAFSTSLYQLVQQKKISEIKTDFINNMTHEFKTPIATINLALDAIKNPKIISDEDKVKRYVQMIRDENKRMHGQVENVLRISKLEKNQIEMSKDAIDMHDIITEAIEHVKLLVANKNGTISTHFEAISNEALGNKFHLTNVVVNILENAVKYSEEEPKIDVFTESTNKYFILKIKDEGIGMSRNAQKYVFNKFYREHKGNIHNVKGHGLGLAYVKEIVDSHQGTVYVESEKSKGSTFTVKLPLI
ncbi:two-component system, OmpR family, phosphate regulon sensor histidine kinase PhoR [Tenacibaculum sp. MAR_2009_124]|nr:two-component system, OmpR family, phosphate regulon sensor histidine kinase PhoR [Tenacibaculum sp. MAR_2009_124]